MKLQFGHQGFQADAAKAGRGVFGGCDKMREPAGGN
jgi:hypothetical protein